MVTQLAREAGAYVVATGRAADPQTALDFGAQEFVDLEDDVDRAQLSEIVQRVRDGRRSSRPSDARGRRSSAFAREASDGERSWPPRGQRHAGRAASGQHVDVCPTAEEGC